MRTIKFKQAVYSNDKFNHWHYWGFLPDLSFVGPDSINGLAHALANSLQFTGLCDKNGKEIYEGDIVKAPAMERDAICEVCWMMNCWCLKTAQKDGRTTSTGLTNYGGEAAPEVIGSIHTTPELLEEPKGDKE